MLKERKAAKGGQINHPSPRHPKQKEKIAKRKFHFYCAIFTTSFSLEFSLFSLHFHLENVDLFEQKLECFRLKNDGGQQLFTRSSLLPTRRVGGYFDLDQRRFRVSVSLTVFFFLYPLFLATYIFC